MDQQRPNPEVLLSTIKAEENQRSKGKLYVFFGMCPGVGKTFAMLKAAHQIKSQGLDIVVGIVETHGRKETQELLNGLEQIPRRSAEYKGTQIQEMDLDAILVRKPEYVLVDELAHTNAPGSRHTKRYQDIEEILNSGINVYTTVNVQHIESRSDLVNQITGTQIRETVPDLFLQNAYQIVLIDLAAEDLLKRLSEGKIYQAERARQASENFFKIENLTALRELSLRFTAEKVDHQLRDQMNLKQIMGPWNTNERLLVAISHSPYSSRLIRSARRMAFNLEAPWIALYIDTDLSLTEDDERTLKKNLQLAKELGAEVITVKDSDIAACIKRVCEEKNVTQVVMGRPDKRFIQDFLAKGSLLDKLVRETSKIDIHVVRQERKPKYIGFYLKLPKLRTGFIGYWYTVWTLIGISFVSYAVHPWLGYRAVGFIFLLTVLIISSFASRGSTLFSAIASTIIWNFFFIPPVYTFAITTTEDFMMCFAYLVVALVAGYLSQRIRKQEEDLLTRESRSNLLYEFGKQISQAKDNLQIAGAANETIAKLIPSETALLTIQQNEDLSEVPLNYIESPITEKEIAVAKWAFKNQTSAGWSTETLNSSRCLCLPLKGKTKTVGILLLFPKETKDLSLDQITFLDNIVNHVAVTIERNIFETEAKKSFLLKESEKLHQALLNSVSHELRTPITSILGSATALSDVSTFQNPEARSMLIQSLTSSSERLNRVVENLLDMSRISSGMLQIKKEIFELNDFVDSFVQRTAPFFKDHHLTLELSPEEIFIQGDDRLLEQVFTNLTANAAAYSKAGTRIIFRILKTSNTETEIQVIDEGSGINNQYIEHIFEPFFRVPGTPSGGTGLGLAICKSFVDAHGGRITVQNKLNPTGTIFSVYLKTEPFELLRERNHI